MTATIEKHPHLESSAPFLSIHPCRHAVAMKALMDSMGLITGGSGGSSVSGGNGGSTGSEAPDPNAAVNTSASSSSSASVAALLGQYMPLFLKLIATMLPTLDYDFTADVGLNQ